MTNEVRHPKLMKSWWWNRECLNHSTKQISNFSASLRSRVFANAVTRSEIESETSLMMRSWMNWSLHERESREISNNDQNESFPRSEITAFRVSLRSSRGSAFAPLVPHEITKCIWRWRFIHTILFTRNPESYENPFRDFATRSARASSGILRSSFFAFHDFGFSYDFHEVILT